MEKRKKIITAVVVVVLLVGTYMIYQYLNFVSSDNAQVNANSVLIASKVAGYITKVNVEEGQKVKAGDVLVEIDERDYQNNLTQAKGELASNEARRVDAEKNYKRIADLFRQSAVPQQQFDQATANYNSVRAQYDSLAAAVAQAQLNLENTKIRAPSDGFIAKKSAEIGQLAAPGTPLIGFVDSHARWVIANLKETELDGVKVGNSVEMSIDAIPSKTFHGKVESIFAATGATFTLLPPDNATGNFTKVIQRVPVRISLDNLTPDDIEKLRAGLSVDVKIRIH
jgi:membrane fusion protein (multidrug efflux system)